MACDSRPAKRNQTLQQRVAEVRGVVAKVQEMLQQRLVKVRVGPQGAVVFDGITDEQRDGVSDACIYRLIMATGSALARQQIARAEQLAGRGVDRRVLAQGTHSHDFGSTWHGKD